MPAVFEFHEQADADVQKLLLSNLYCGSWNVTVPLALLTTQARVGILDNMQAQLITAHKGVEADGSIIQFVFWKVPVPVPPSSHALSTEWSIFAMANGSSDLIMNAAKAITCTFDGKELRGLCCKNLFSREGALSGDAITVRALKIVA